MADLSGVLGTWNLYAYINQAIYYNNDDAASAVTVSLCNKGGSDTLVSMAISASPTAPTSAEWFRFNDVVASKGVFEKTGILVPPGKYVVVKATTANVNAVIYGVRAGTALTTTTPSQNLGTPPAWVTTDVNLYAAATTTSVQLQSTDPENESVTYALTSGTLPGTLSISSSGLITGTVSSSGYSSGAVPVTTTAVVTATDVFGNATPRTLNIIRNFADGASSGRAIPFGTLATDVTAMTGQTSGDIWVQDKSGTPVLTKLYKTGGTAYLLMAGISDNTDHGQYTPAIGTGQWIGQWTSTSTFGTYDTANQRGGYKNTLWWNYDYDDILIMQGFTAGAISGDYYTNSNEVARTTTNWLSTRGRNLRSFFRGDVAGVAAPGPDLTRNGNKDRTIVPVTFIKGDSGTVRGRYKAAGAQTELSANNTLDFGQQNCEGYRFAVVNALGCQATGCNIEHTSWVADVSNNYSQRNYPEPAWDGPTWGINAPNNWLYWLWWAKS